MKIEEYYVGETVMCRILADLEGTAVSFQGKGLWETGEVAYCDKNVCCMCWEIDKSLSKVDGTHWVTVMVVLPRKVSHLYFAGILVITCNNILCVSWCCQYLLGSLYFLTCKEWRWNSTYFTPLLPRVHNVKYAVSALCACIPCMTAPIPTNGCVRIWVSKSWFHYMNKNSFSTLHVSGLQLVLDFYSPRLKTVLEIFSFCL